MIKQIKNNSSVFYYIPGYLNKEEQLELFKYFEQKKDFVPTPSYTNNISRLQKWIQSEKKYFCSEWEGRFPQWESFEQDEKITDIQNKIQSYIREQIKNIKIPNINSCLINKYPNGQHFIAPHRDSQISFGEEPTIINLSLGATRTLVFENNNEKFTFDLESGSLFIMGGASQKCYLHSIKKSECNDIRYSLTFREFIL